jgi:hypothetical protein
VDAGGVARFHPNPTTSTSASSTSSHPVGGARGGERGGVAEEGDGGLPFIVRRSFRAHAPASSDDDTLTTAASSETAGAEQLGGDSGSGSDSDPDTVPAEAALHEDHAAPRQEPTPCYSIVSGLIY